MGRPDTIKGGEEPEADKWERHSGSESSAKEREEEEEDVQEFSADKAGQEAPRSGSGWLNQILESISALASSVSLLQVQVDRELRLPQHMMRKADPLR